MQTGATDHQSGVEGSGDGFQEFPAAVVPDFQHASVQFDFSAVAADQFGEFLTDGRVVHNPFLGHMDGRDAGGVRFNFFDLPRIQFAQALQSVGQAALPQRFQSWQFVFGGGYNNLAA